MQQKIFFSKIIIIGLGLIGGSVARSCKRLGLAPIISATDIDEEQLNYALANNIIDEVYNFDQQLFDGDLVVIATPLKTYQDIAQRISSNLSKNTIICDVGSLKYFVEDEVIPDFGKNGKNFVACHPIAGSDKAGVENSNSELFLNKKLIITPFLFNEDKTVNKVADFWQEMGSQIEFMDAKDHDKIYALVSHLPQMISFENKVNLPKFMSTTQIIDLHLRLENSNQKMWEDIFSFNKGNLDYYLQIYLDNLQLIRSDLESGRLDSVVLFLEKTSHVAKEFNLPDMELDKGEQSLLLTRVIIVSCYLNLPDIKEFKNYSATGFRDFIVILSYLKSFLKEGRLIDILKDIKL